nr:reverse transcriptase domain-containing protein [Tanacetum cinerariifolium]
MSKSVERAPTPADSVIRNTSRKGSKQATDGTASSMLDEKLRKGSKQATDGTVGSMPDEKLREFYDRHYNQLLPLMAKKVHQEKLQEKEVHQGPRRNPPHQAKGSKINEAFTERFKAESMCVKGAPECMRQVKRQKVTQSFSTNQEMSFPSLASDGEQESPMVIEAEIGGHFIHRMYMDGVFAFEVLGRDVPRPRCKHKGNQSKPIKRRGSFKATFPKRAKGNFIAEKLDEDASSTWIEIEEEILNPLALFTDGSSCLEGSGAELIPTSPKGMTFTYALRFKFVASNNEAKYEALLAKLRIMEKIGIEAKPMATIAGNQIKKFVWDNIVCRFGLPGEIISDNIKQFRYNPFKDWCNKLNIKQKFASVKHPQTNGLVDRANHNLREGIKEKLDQEAIILVEIGMPSLRYAEIEQVQNDEALMLNLDMLEEKRERVVIREAKRKANMENTKMPKFVVQPSSLETSCTAATKPAMQRRAKS